MYFFRKKRIKYFLLLFTGIAFLNLSFFLAEVSLLKLDKDNRMIETITNVITGAGFEEESETTSDSHETGSSLKEVKLLITQNLNHHGSLFLIAQQRNGILVLPRPESGFSQVFSPPPEV